jgi:hypothetical protein
MDGCGKDRRGPPHRVYVSPEGTTESSPGRQSWVHIEKFDQSRKGRLKAAPSLARIDPILSLNSPERNCDRFQSPARSSATNWETGLSGRSSDHHRSKSGSNISELMTCAGPAPSSAARRELRTLTNLKRLVRYLTIPNPFDRL